MDNYEQQIRENLAYNLRVERAKRKLSQQNLAKLAHLSAKQISQIENTKVLPSIYVILKIATTLGISVNTLITKD